MYLKINSDLENILTNAEVSHVEENCGSSIGKCIYYSGIVNWIVIKPTDTSLQYIIPVNIFLNKFYRNLGSKYIIL